ncbi:MAG: alpha/beta hydrolase [Eubacterium sp.]|nr:alpha/beta hydrolase [Eubacterium sp.]
MKKIKGIFKRILIVLLVIIFAIAVVRTVGRGIKSRTPEGGINESMYVDINGSKQWINIYGKNKDNPVLLYLHGGPGSPTSPYDHAFTRKWSDVYTVVTWDQRNVGKSFHKNESVEINRDVMMEDGKEMTEFLLSYLNKDKITLLGHSWGSIFGANLALEYPDYYEAFIGTGQCVDLVENEKRLYEAAKTWTEGDEEGQALLAKWAPGTEDSSEAIKARSATMARYGYGMLKDGTDYSIIAALLFNPNYTVIDYISFIKNLNVALEPYNKFFDDGIPGFSLTGRYDYEIPYYNIDGDKDYQTNFELACEYFEQVNAPNKKMYVMKDGTHGLLESRSEEFSEYIHDIAKIQSEGK